MSRQIVAFIEKCDVCQRQKAQTQKPAGLLRPLPIPMRPWDDVSMDLITDLPKSSRDNFENILTVIDRFSKMAHFIPLTADTTAEAVANAFVKVIVR